MLVTSVNSGVGRSVGGVPGGDPGGVLHLETIAIGLEWLVVMLVSMPVMNPTAPVEAAVVIPPAVSLATEAKPHKNTRPLKDRPRRPVFRLTTNAVAAGSGLPVPVPGGAAELVTYQGSLFESMCLVSTLSKLTVG